MTMDDFIDSLTPTEVDLIIHYRSLSSKSCRELYNFSIKQQIFDSWRQDDDVADIVDNYIDAREDEADIGTIRRLFHERREEYLKQVIDA